MSSASAQYWYDVGRFFLYSTSPMGFILFFFFDAPFGRFALSNSVFALDGIKSWICMELVSPVTFISAFLASPLAPHIPPIPWTHPSVLLVLLYVVHYLNRSLISPLRTPSRSRSHISVTISGIIYNLINGFTMGAYLSSPAARSFLADAYTRPVFFLGVALWAAGFAGNVLHDEILLDIRRKAVAKRENGSSKSEYYGIPQGMLYSVVSYPNYFCEWVEWLGFAIAAAPLPREVLVTSGFVSALKTLSFGELVRSGMPKTVTPPWIFVASEVLVMLPRAYRGHRWYLNKFAEYPKNRKIVVPFIL